MNLINQHTQNSDTLQAFQFLPEYAPCLPSCIQWYPLISAHPPIHIRLIILQEMTSGPKSTEDC